MDWLRKLMAGRYGGDQLSITLIIFSAMISLAAGLTRFPWLGLLSYLLLGLAIFRTFSRNIDKRRMENYRFAIIMSPVYSWFRKHSQIARNRIRDAKTHRYYSCPKCRQSLRVPKGKGKIVITCPKCKTEFAKKT